jgi:hypothetical protein
LKTRWSKRLEEAKVAELAMRMSNAYVLWRVPLR